MIDLHPNPTERVPVLGLCSPDVAMTTSYDDVFPATVHARYDFAETRNAARILQATNPEQFEDLVAVMDQRLPWTRYSTCQRGKMKAGRRAGSTTPSGDVDGQRRPTGSRCRVSWCCGWPGLQ